MKKTVFLAFVTIVCLAGCKSKHQQASADSTQVGNGDVFMSILSEMDDREVIAIQDREGEHPVDLFMGSSDDSLLVALSHGEAFKSTVNAFLIRASGYYNDLPERNILIDAGLGTEQGGALIDGLNELGVRPEEIDAVCLTHLHPDHIGGLLKDGLPAFPKATIYLSVEEFEAWSDNGVFASRNELWKQVLANYANSIQPVQDGDTIVDGWIVVHLAPGHTPGHTVYESGLCLFVGDLLHAQDLQLEHPEFCARYDNAPEQAVATRRQWLSSLGEGMFLCGAHCYNPFIQRGKW